MGSPIYAWQFGVSRSPWWCTLWTGVTPVTADVSWRDEGNIKRRDGCHLNAPSSRLHLPNKHKNTCCLFVNRILVPHHVSLFPDCLRDLFQVSMNMLCVSLLSFFPVRSFFFFLPMYFQSSSMSLGNLAKVATSNQSHGLFHPTWIFRSFLLIYPRSVVPVAIK